jgi:hypothetical protein
VPYRRRASTPYSNLLVSKPTSGQARFKVRQRREIPGLLSTDTGRFVRTLIGDRNSHTTSTVVDEYENVVEVQSAGIVFDKEATMWKWMPRVEQIAKNNRVAVQHEVKDGMGRVWFARDYLKDDFPTDPDLYKGIAPTQAEEKFKWATYAAAELMTALDRRHVKWHWL